MFLLPLGYALAIVVTIASYWLYSHKNPQKSHLHRSRFVWVAFVLGCIVNVSHEIVVRGVDENIAVIYTFAATLIYSSFLYIVYRVVLRVPPRFRRYIVISIIVSLSIFSGMILYWNYSVYKNLTTVPLCREQSVDGLIMTEDGQEGETSMHRLFNIPYIDYCISPLDGLRHSGSYLEKNGVTK